MAITRWAPFSAFTSLEREMQDMMSRFHTRPFLEGFEWRPTTDVYEEEGKLIVRSEIPGIDLEDLEIKVEDNVLHISGEKKLEKEISEDDRYVRECRFGAFRRDVMLPEGVDIDGIKADYDNGVLMIRVPLPMEVEKPRAVKIPVEVPVTTDTSV